MLNRTLGRVSARVGLPLALALMAGSALAQNMSRPYYSIDHPRVLVMTSGGAGEAEIARQALAYTATSVNYQTTFIDDPKLIDAKTLSQFKVFVQYGAARITPTQEKALSDFVSNGGGFLALHDAIDGPRGGPYEKLVGGNLVRHAGPYKIYVHVTEEGRNSPITSGMQDFEILEEQIFANYAVDPPKPPGGAQATPAPAAAAAPGARRPRRAGPAHGLITGFAMDNTVDPERLQLRTNQITNPIAGWWQDVGKGRMVYLSVGSSTAGMNNPNLQKMYENAFRWLGREQ